jgi:iron complex transport system permease protein
LGRTATKKQIMFEKYKHTMILSVGFCLLIVLCLLSLYIGRYPITPGDLFRFVFYGQVSDPNLPVVLFNIRLPRILAAIAVGGALSIAGTAYQGLFRNPMVSPDILGVTSGAGLGAAVAILLSLPVVGIQMLSFAGGLSAVLLAVSIGKSVGKGHDVILVLVLSGMIISSLCGALLSLTKYLADPDDKLPAITYWLMGSLASIRLDDLSIILPIIAAGVIPLWLLSWQLNVLSFGEDESRSLGINTSVLRAVIILSASLVTASIVAVSGIIGWVGLIVPHITRMITGPNHRILLPASFLFGGLFLLVVDNLARSVSSVEIPIGILTAVIGAPFFLFFLKKSKRIW